MKLSTQQHNEFTSLTSRYRLYDIGPSCWPVYDESRNTYDNGEESYRIRWKRNSYHFILKTDIIGYHENKPIVKIKFNVIHQTTFCGSNTVEIGNPAKFCFVRTPNDTLAVDNFMAKFKNSNIDQPFICIQVR